MNLKIKKIRKLNGGRYKIELDELESLILYEDVILNNNILYKKDLTLEQIKNLNKENEYYELYNKALKYVLTKMRSIYEVDKYLEKLEVKENSRKEIINKLKDINLLNDKVYASAFISDKIYLSNDGPLKIKNDLLNKQVDESIIDEELSKYDLDIFEEKIKKIISKKKNNKYSNYVFKQKMLRYFVNLGYDSNFVIPLLENVESDTSNLLQKEYDNLYRKLSRKYSEKKLDYEIRARLYRKGFSVDEINTIIKE